uniref:Utp12 domain-containing protein n=1 Tax=Angiostrongylus cantonensis TaxID=6313 RepID=A0A0K0CSW4_ANGCA
MVKQRKLRKPEDPQNSEESVRNVEDLDVSRKKTNGTLEDVGVLYDIHSQGEHEGSETPADEVRDCPKIKKGKFLTMGQLLQQQCSNIESEITRPSGSSLAVQVAQGLMSNDVLKLDSVLREAKVEIIQIRNLETELSGLLEWMRIRIGHQQKLLELHGKLSIVGEQIERRINRTVTVAPQPLMVFNDDMDSDLEDVESGGSDESAASSDEEEEEWWDESGLGVGDESSEDSDSDESDGNSDLDMLRKEKVDGKSDSGGEEENDGVEEESSGDEEREEDSEHEMDIG